jgi:integrase
MTRYDSDVTRIQEAMGSSPVSSTNRINSYRLVSCDSLPGIASGRCYALRSSLCWASAGRPHSQHKQILQESEVHRMFALEPNRRNRIILKTLYYAGLRVSEPCGLRWRDLHPRGRKAKSQFSGRAERLVQYCFQPVFGAS